MGPPLLGRVSCSPALSACYKNSGPHPLSSGLSQTAPRLRNETGVEVSGPFSVGSGDDMVLNLEYSVIRTSQGGPYSCQATASILQASLHISASSIINITVQSEYQNCSLVVRSGGMLQVEV